MPNNSNTTGNLEISSLSLPVLNDRLRRIGQLLGVSGDSVSAASATSATNGVSQLVFTVPGILAVQSDACPIVELAAAQSFSKMLALVKSAPIGSALTVQMYVGGNAWGPPLSIAAGGTSASGSLAAAPKISANSIVRLDITGVGALLTGVSYPGSDLTVILR